MISEELKNDLKIKWDRMRDGMAKMGMDACLLTVDVNLYYTTGQIYSCLLYTSIRCLFSFRSKCRHDSDLAYGIRYY